MSEITFRYNRAPTGELSGASMVEQTEQALSEISRESSQAEGDAAEAKRIAQIAETHASEAQTAATTAQETATAAGTAAATAQATANNAVTSANAAQAAAQGAAQTATAAAQSAANAQTAAQNAATAAQQSEAKAGQAVQTATDAVTTAGQAVTTADNAVTRAAQAETNVGNAVSAAQRAQSSAAQSAASAAELADPNRYSAKITELTLSAGQTINYSDLDNSNVAVGNRIIDAVGNIFQIASIDSANQTVTLVAADPDATPPTTGFWKNPLEARVKALDTSLTGKLEKQVIYGGAATAEITSSTQTNVYVYFDAKEGYMTIPFGATTNGWVGSPYISSFSDTQARVWWSNTAGQDPGDSITVFLLYIKK